MIRKHRHSRWTWYPAIAVGLACGWCGAAGAQTNVIKSIRALDTNYNKYLEPHEITDRARVQLKRYAPYGRIDILRPNYLGRWEEAVYRYYERRRTGGQRVRPETPSPLTDFDRDRDAPVVPGFGLGDVRYPYRQEDLEEADDTLRRADRNDDGYVDRAEARRSEWTRTNPFSSDFNRDNRLSRIELAQRYAARRLLEKGAERRYNSMRRNRDGLDRYSSSRRSSSGQRDARARILSDSLMGRYDRNRDRKLSLSEFKDLNLDVAQIDLDRNDEITREELDDWIRREIESRSDELTAALPTWFFERDINGDGQIQVSEYADELTAEKLGEFLAMDLNDDGIVTAAELARGPQTPGGTYTSQTAEILPPRSTVVSEIEVPDDVVISDLNVQLSLTHTYVAHLDGYLIGPDGHRIELFTEIGRDGDHFEGTVFDDEAKVNINRGRAPYRGHFQPESLAKKQSGLNRYRDKSAQGLWQLMLRSSRSDRPGMLHGWSLNINSKPPTASSTAKPQERKDGRDEERDDDDRDARRRDKEDAKREQDRRQEERKESRRSRDD